MLRQHLHKEWREQRILLAAITGVLLVMAMGFGLLLPSRVVRYDTVAWFVIVALATGVVCLVGDLVPGERRRGQLDLLRRLPGGMRASFLAKAVTAVAGLAGLAGAAWLVGWVSVLIAGGGLQWYPRVNANSVPAFAAAAVAGPWVFMTSTFLRRGAAVVPVTTFLLAVVVGAPVLLVESHEVPVTETQALLAALSVLVAGIVGAWHAYVRGLPLGTGSAAARATVGLLCLVPAWLWSLDRTTAWYRFDPHDRRFWFTDAAIGEGGRYAFCTARWRGESPASPSFAVAIDLRSGDYRVLSDAGTAIGTVCPQFALPPFPRLRPWVLVACRATAAMPNTDGELLSVVDGRTGEELHIPDRDRDRAAKTAIVLPDGTRAWHTETHTVVERTDGTRTVVPWPDGARPGWPLGFGFSWRDARTGRRRGVHDVARGRTFDVPEDAPMSIAVRPGRWLFFHADEGGVWRRFDPETGAVTPMPLETNEQMSTLASDGRCYVVTAAGEALLLDPDSGERTPLRLVGAPLLAIVGAPLLAGTPARPARIDHPDQWRFLPPAQTPDGHDVVRIIYASDSLPFAGYARRDGNDLLCTPTSIWRERPIGIPDEDHIVVLRDATRIVRRRFGSDETETVFALGPPWYETIE